MNQVSDQICADNSQSLLTFQTCLPAAAVRLLLPAGRQGRQQPATARIRLGAAGRKALPTCKKDLGNKFKGLPLDALALVVCMYVALIL